MSEIELARSLAFTDHYFDVDTLRRISSDMRQGKALPTLSDAEEARFIEASKVFGASRILFAATNRDSGRRLQTPMLPPRFRTQPTAKSNNLKRVGSAILRGYFAVGGLLATIMWSSYLIPFTWGASYYMSDSTFFQRIMAVRFLEPLAILTAAARIVFWGPSLAAWIVSQPIDHPFSMWLAPGLYTEVSASHVAPKATFTKRKIATNSADRITEEVIKKCFGKEGLEVFTGLYTIEMATALCPDAIDIEQRMQLLANLARYQNDDPDCKNAVITLKEPVKQVIIKNYERDGEEFFCKWAKHTFGRKNATPGK